MSCSECKKQSVCFIVRTFEKARDEVYPWWEPRPELLWNFVGSNCLQFEQKTPDS